MIHAGIDDIKENDAGEEEQVKATTPPLPLFEDSLSLYELCAHFCCLASGELLHEEIVATQGVISVEIVGKMISYCIIDKFSDKKIMLLYDGQLKNGDVVSVQGTPGKTADGKVMIKVSDIVVQMTGV